MIDNIICYSNYVCVYDKCLIIVCVLICFGKFFFGELLVCYVFFFIVVLLIKELIIYFVIFCMNYFLFEELIFLIF